MIMIFTKPEIDDWLHLNMNKYEIQNKNQYIAKQYSGNTTSSDNFDIKSYTTGTLSIDGTLQKRVYSKIIKELKETNYVGYDEVGVGDFFGPTVYVSVLLDPESINALAKTGMDIRDSKKMDDIDILKTFEILKDIITYKSQIVYDKDIGSLNSIDQKCVYHNKNIIASGTTHVVDLFTTEKSFFKYTKDNNLTWPSGLVLETKADGKYYTVALASIFARALFITEMDNLNIKYDMVFPYGAGNVKKTAGVFINRYSKKELATFCKTSFKTFNEV